MCPSYPAGGLKNLDGEQMQIKQVYEYYDRKGSEQSSAYIYCPLCQTPLTDDESGNIIRPNCKKCGFVHYQNPWPVVSILIVDDERILLGKRSEDPEKGKWALPSGYIEFGNDFITTAILEAKEETGLEIEIQSIINVMSSFYSRRFHFLVIYLKAQVVRGKLKAGDDLEEVNWYSIAEEFPEIAFDEDRDMLTLYISGNYQEFPIDIEYAGQVNDG